MRKIVDNERMMLRVCDLYYNRDMSQSDIAKIMDISRPTVARLLKSAKLKRIVEITISDPQERRYSELEQKLEKTYHLQEVIIADTVSTTNCHHTFSIQLENLPVFTKQHGRVVLLIINHPAFPRLLNIPRKNGWSNLMIPMDCKYSNRQRLCYIPHRTLL